MKKLIVASLLVSASFGASANTVVKICDAALTSFYGSEILSVMKKSAVISDSVNQFSVYMPASDDIILSPDLTPGEPVTVKDVTFLRLKNGEGYSIGSHDDDTRVNFINCVKAIKS